MIQALSMFNGYDHTVMCLFVLEEAMERDKFMSAEEAASFGLIDHVVLRTPIREQ